jgi:hypothetical protein
MRTFTTLACLALAAVAIHAQQPQSQPAVPDMPDLMIRTREVHNAPRAATTTEVIYLKGARQRRESVFDGPARTKWNLPSHRGLTHISQCEEHRYLILNDDVKTYAYQPITRSAVYARAVARMAETAPPELRPDGPVGAKSPVVTNTIDVVDTGERRKYGSYTARHVITTTTTEPGPGAVSRAGISQVDGWYLDLPDQNCEDMNTRPWTRTMLVASGQDRYERIETKLRGTARTGYPIEVMNRNSGGRFALNSRIELVEISEAPIDDAMFTIPPGYHAAMPDPRGGYDMMKPDTFMNRVESYERVIEDWAYYLIGINSNRRGY